MNHTTIDKQIRRGKALLRELKTTLEDLEDRRELAAARKRNAGKHGTPLRQAAKELGFDDLVEERAKNGGKPRVGHAEVKKRSQLNAAPRVKEADLLFEVGYQVANADKYPEWKPGNEFKPKRE